MFRLLGVSWTSVALAIGAPQAFSSDPSTRHWRAAEDDAVSMPHVRRRDVRRRRLALEHT
jgi:hypothetical protein